MCPSSHDSFLRRAAAQRGLLLGSGCRSVLYDVGTLCATARPNQHLSSALRCPTKVRFLPGGRVGAGYRRIDFVRWHCRFLFTCLWCSFGTSEWAGGPMPAAPHNACGPHAGGLGPAHGVSGPQHAGVGSLYVCIMYNKMGVEGGVSACLGRCTYNTEKAVVKNVVTKAEQSNKVRHGRPGKISR